MKNEMTEFKKINIEKEYESFIDYLDISAKTVRAYKDGVSKFLEYLKDNKIEQPTRIDFKNFRESLKGNLTSNSINSYLTSCRAFFKYLSAMNIYPDITKDVKSIKTSSVPKRQVLSQEQCQKIYSSLTDKEEKALFGLAITTGLRASELASAKIDNIKVYNNEFVLFIKCKKRDDDSEYVKLSDKVLNDIFEYIGQRTTGNIFVSTSPNNFNGGVSSVTIRTKVKNILKRFGFNEYGVSCHTLRRSMATIAYLNGIDIHQIQQVLHQRSIATTQRYINQVTRDCNKTEFNMSQLILG